MSTERAYRVVIDCPSTHREVDTGRSMTKNAFKEQALEHGVLDCSHCGQRHEYKVATARLRDHYRPWWSRSGTSYLRARKKSHRSRERV